MTLPYPYYADKWEELECEPVVTGGASIVIRDSLFNHSCDHNIAWQVKGENRSQYMTVCKNITKGEEVNVNYRYYYLDKIWPVRQLGLYVFYRFRCQCIPCRNEEPQYKENPTYAVMFNEEFWQNL